MAREEKLSRFGSSSSWADEVEREEREEAQKLRNRFAAKTDSRKPNPFGAARPREVVLEEKGVDWRKLDQDLDHCHSILRKDKKPEKNIPLTPPPIIRHGSHPLGSICMGQKKPYPAKNTSPLVPPIMYAPKNIMALTEQIRRGRKDLMDAPVENPCNVRKRAHHIVNKEPIIPREEEYYSVSRYERNCFGERSFAVDEQMHSNGRRQILADLNMERANYEKYRNGGENCRPQHGRRMSFAYGNRSSERTPARHCSDYRICDAERGDSNGGGLRSDGYGVRERTNTRTMRDEGVDLRNATSTKRRLAAVQPGPCHRRRRGKQSRK